MRVSAVLAEVQKPPVFAAIIQNLNDRKPRNLGLFVLWQHPEKRYIHVYTVDVIGSSPVGPTSQTPGHCPVMAEVALRRGW